MHNFDRTQILLEDMNGKFDAIMEYVKDIPAMKLQLTNVEERLTGVEGRLTGVEGRLTSVEGRLDRIEEEQRLMRVAVIEELQDVERLKSIHPNFTHS